MTNFADPLSITAYDPKHADDEDRFLTMGTSVDGRLIIVSHADRGGSVRIISGRAATRREKKNYQDGSFPEPTEPDDEIEPEYDFRSLRGAVRGKHAARYQGRLRVVRLDPDVSAAFSDEAAVNAALREYLSWRQDHPAGNIS